MTPEYVIDVSIPGDMIVQARVTADTLDLARVEAVDRVKNINMPLQAKVTRFWRAVKYEGKS